MTDIEVSDASTRSRLATIEDRLLQVEKRLNMPPAAQPPTRYNFNLANFCISRYN